MKKIHLLFFVLFVLILASCDSESKHIYPPENVVNRVTDFYLFNDGKTFLYLNSNMNREYDFGRLVLMRFDEEGDPVFQNSILVPSISGKMTVTPDEKAVFVTSRDENGVVKAKISGKTGSYMVQYDGGTKDDVPEILKTKKEPYALTLNADGSKLLVTHILNGELSVVNVEKWKVVKTSKMKYGVTEIVGITDTVSNEKSEYFLASHKSSGNISLIETKETVDNNFVVAVREMPIDLPTKGYDVRSLKKGGEDSVFYAAFQNSYSEDSYTNVYDEDTAPQIVTLKLDDDKSLQVQNTLALSGNLGEIAVFSYSTETEESEEPETDDADADNVTGGDTAEETDDTEVPDGGDGVKEADDADVSDDMEEKSDDGGEENKTAGRTSDLIFVSMPSEEKVVMIDSVRNAVRDEISYKDDKNECKPYQIYAKKTGNTTGFLFVSCFQNDMVYIYRIDLTSGQIVKKTGVLK